MSSFADRLRVPDRESEYAGWFQELTGGDRLYSWLREYVAAPDSRVRAQMDGVEAVLVAWAAGLGDDPRSGSRRVRVRLLQCLFWCARQAVDCPSAYAGRHAGAAFTLTALPECFRGEGDLAWVGVRSFLAAAESEVRVPLALYNPADGAAGGRLAELVLEVLPDGCGRVALHPADWFACRHDAAFRDSVVRTGQAACRGAEGDWIDGRWRLLHGGQPVSTPQGGSGGAVAARGWAHAVRGRLPDAGVLPIAAVDAAGRPIPVDTAGVTAKVREALRVLPELDTLLLCAGENVAAAEAAVRAAGRQTRVRVLALEPEPVAEWTAPRSWLVEVLCEYLETVRSSVGALPAYYPAHLRNGEGFRTIRQRVQVIVEREKWEQWRA
ncbi:MAG: hypothetical protein FJX77_06775, partial [Armatimonadetes bacterium]|nr:hypothetical protein [Armatimonadota bacterium]